MRIISNVDLGQNELQNTAIQRLATAPGSPVKGQIYFNTVYNRLFYYNGSEWIGADGVGASMTGDKIVMEINASSSLIDDDNLSQGVRDAASKAHDTHSISDVSGLQSALDEKVDGSQVLTNVPINAEFTDTVTTINGKTGAITKADIAALGIPAQDTVYTLPTATSTVLGGIKSGTDITIDASGNVSVNDNSHEHTIENVTGLQGALDAKETPAGATAKASTAENNAKGYTDTKLAELVGSAPETLDTLHELSEALGQDPNFATTIANTLAQKTNKFSQTIGDGTSTSVVLTHNLNTRDAVVMIRTTGAPYEQVIADVEMTTLDTATVRFAVAPAIDQYTITIIG